jgi:hypothetical protein
MRALSFFFAALLGIALAMMAPVLAGPRPEAAPAPLVATLSAEVAPEVAPEVALEPGEATEAGAMAAVDETLNVEQLSRSILEAIGADAA